MTPRISKICVHNLIALADAYCDHCGIISTTLSRDILSDAPALDKIRTGKGSTSLRKFDSAMEWFDKNWPDDLAWPKLEPIPSFSAPVAAPVAKTRTKKALIAFAGDDGNSKRIARFAKRRIAR